MRTYYKLLILILLICVSCKEKPQKLITSTNTKKVSVSLIIDDKKVKLSTYKLYCINNQDTLDFLKDNNNYLIIPTNLEKNKEYEFIFQYKNTTIKFDKIIGKTVVPNQNIEWLFGIDNKPFNKSLALLTEEEYGSKSINRVYYWQFNLLEFGDGVIFVRKD